MMPLLFEARSIAVRLTEATRVFPIDLPPQVEIMTSHFSAHGRRQPRLPWRASAASPVSAPTEEEMCDAEFIRTWRPTDSLRQISLRCGAGGGHCPRVACWNAPGAVAALETRASEPGRGEAGGGEAGLRCDHQRFLHDQCPPVGALGRRLRVARHGAQ